MMCALVSWNLLVRFQLLAIGSGYGSFFIRPVDIWGRDSAVSTATSYGLYNGGVGVRVPVGSRIFSTMSRPALGPTQLSIQCVPGAPFPEVKRQGREADHSPPTSS
jgi:hypothetical protein